MFRLFSELKTHIDDEYARAGIQDPRILLTTSRDPSSRLTQFLKELRLVFPNSQRINRGNAVVKELVEAARTNDFSDLIIVHEHRGEPDGLIVTHLPYGPTAYFGLSNVVLRHDLSSKLGTMSEAAPHLIFDNFSTALGARLQTLLSSLFPVPKDDSRRVMTFANREDLISFRHHVYKKTGASDLELGEVGPRFEAKLYQLKLGTVDMPEAEMEWVLRPFMNTAKKRKALG
ncbi:MAG: Brix domain-containing protein [Dehalococcoidales bacterium]|nr:Brix domain-containing protein [Dehalococcoidales bacterium]